MNKADESKRQAALQVSGDGFSYPIYIGQDMHQDALNALKTLSQDGAAQSAVIITDENVNALYGAAFEAALKKSGYHVKARRVLPVGEVAKSFAALEQTINDILASFIDRHCIIFALGGGVVGDHGGFAASIVLRGLPYIQIPTTLLAMVDSAVGGKTGINMPHGKNLVGSFYQPQAVICDLNTLDSLPEREYWAGYAEVVKYAFMNDKEFFDDLHTNREAIKARDKQVLAAIVKRCCANKAAIVAEDEREQGKRALLNLGHTFGHALEAENAYGADLIHGEAVAIGMAMAFAFSAKLGFCQQSDAEQVRQHLQEMGLPVHIDHIKGLAGLQAETMLQHMRKDKKVKNGRIRLILARGIGQSFIADDVAEDDLRNFLAAYLKDRHR